MSQHRARIVLCRQALQLLAATALVLAIGVGGVVPPAAAVAPRSDSQARAGAKALPNVPSIQYAQAMEHASDRIAFEPGAAVTVPYRPRPGDRTLINGHPPVALPAGRVSGAAMAASPEGTTWTGSEPGDTAVPADASSPFAATTGLADSVELTSFQAPSEAASAVPAASANTLRREVYGFLPYWEVGVALNYDVLSTIAYFGVGYESDGDIIKSDSGWAGWTSQSMTNVINAAHSRGARVTLTVEMFAWNTSQANSQTALLSSATARQKAAAQTAAAVRDRGADGVNVDFEPIASGQKANFVAFIKTLRTELNKINPGYGLTFDVTGYVGNYDVAALTATGAADAVFIMGYDFRTASNTKAGSIAPLTSPTVYDLTNAVDAYRALTPASKIILGLPYYGRAWTTISTLPNATTVNDGCGAVPTYSQAADLAATNGRRYDTIEQSAWTTYKNSCGQRELYYDDAQSLGAKYDMINYWGLRGSGIWALGYDDGHTELAQVIASKFLNDKTPPKAGIRNLAPIQASEGFRVTWTGRDDWNGIKTYDVQVATDGGAWTNWLVGTTATSGTFTGVSGHGYAFRVRATDGVGNVGAWDVSSQFSAPTSITSGGYLRIATDSLNMRSGPTVSAAAVDQASSGEIYQVIGGPTSADGYTWFQINGPILETSPVTPVFPGTWIAVCAGSQTYAVATTAPNSTSVSAPIRSLTVGNAGLVQSSVVDRSRIFSPNGDGIQDTMNVAWTNGAAFTSMTLSVVRTDGSVAGTIALGASGPGAQTFTWDGKIGGAPVANGRYLLQVSGVSGGVTYYSPSPAPFGADQWAIAGVTVDSTASGTYRALAPVRILDTRYGVGLSGKFVYGTPRSLVIAGQNGVPANAIGVTGNLTVTNATAAGFLRLGPVVTGTFSTINFGAKDDRANGVTVGLASGKLSACYDGAPAGATVDVIFDLTGYFVGDASGTTFVPIAPARLVDTRTPLGLGGRLVSGAVGTFAVAGKAAIPASATAITGNLTITDATSRGYVTLAPSLVPGAIPASSTINFPAGDVRANNVTVPLGSGKLQVEFLGTKGSTVNVVFDVTGYFLPGLSGGTFVPLYPGRVVDTRCGLGVAGALTQGASASFPVVGKAGVTGVAFAVVGNLTVTGQTSKGWLSVAPTKSTSTSTLNFPVGENRANEFVGGASSGGTLTVTFGGGSTGSKAQVVVDMVGYYR